MQTVLLTGGAGFIGSHLCEGYLEAGYKVAVVDSLITGKKKQVPKKCQFFKVDITDQVALQKIFEQVKPTIVSHHAAQTKIAVSDNLPVVDASVNILGLLNVLTLCQKHEIEHFIFASSAAVYGVAKKLPSKENDRLNPQSAYGIAKMCGEQYVRFFAQKASFSATIFRYANVYGPRQLGGVGEGGVVAIFINQMLKKIPPTIYGDGVQTRDFIFVGDVVKANLQATQQRLDGTYNLGTERPIAIKNLYAMMAKLFTFNQKPLFQPVKKNEVKHSSLSAKSFDLLLGKTKKTTLKKGLAQTLASFKK